VTGVPVFVTARLRARNPGGKRHRGAVAVGARQLSRQSDPVRLIRRDEPDDLPSVVGRSHSQGQGRGCRELEPGLDRGDDRDVERDEDDELVAVVEQAPVAEDVQLVRPEQCRPALVELGLPA